MRLRSSTWLCLACACALQAAAAPAATVILKFATLAPDGSAWIQALEKIKKEVLEATGGQVQIKVYPAGVMGDEKDVLFKIKVGQLDGGGFLGTGMGTVCPDARALMSPFLFNGYDEADAVFAGMTEYLDRHCRENGFVALGWTEVGFSYLFSAKPVRSIEDVRGAKPWSIPNEQMLAELFKAGRVSTIPVPVGDVLTALQTGLLQTVYTPALPCVAMQWYTKLRYRNDLRLTYSFGILAVSEKSWQRVPADLQPKIVEICHQRIRDLNVQVRASDGEALAVMAKSGMQVVTSSAAEQQEFIRVSEEALPQIEGSVFTSKAWDMAQDILKDYRARAAGDAHAP